MNLKDYRLLSRLLKTVDKLLSIQANESAISATPNTEKATGSSNQDYSVELLTIAERIKQFKENYTAEEKNSNATSKKALAVQKWLCFFTAGAFVAAAYYAHVAAQEREIMSNTLDTQERAYLAAGEPTQDKAGPTAQISIPIINYGHKSSTHEFFGFLYAYGPMSAPYAALKHERFDVRKDTVIAPGPAGYTLNLTPPRMSPSDLAGVAAGTQVAIFRVTVQYDTGFDNTDTFQLCLAYSPFVDKKWKACGRAHDFIDLENEKPTKTQ